MLKHCAKIFILLVVSTFSLLGEVSKPNVLIVGGAGFIGSYVNKLLIQQGYNTIVLDNLSNSSKEAIVGGHFVEGDIADKELLEKLFTSCSIDVVMHFAAFKNVGESCKDPAKYYQNNVSNSITLLNAMLKHRVPFFIFSSTAAIFSSSEEKPITEEMACAPLSPYGRSKLMMENILRDYSQAYSFKYCALRYFNAVGGDPEGIIKNSEKEPSNLIPCALKSIKQNLPFTIFGTDYPTKDGTCIRDYIHIHDLAEAHLLAMEYLLAGKESNYFNLGNGKGYSVLEVLQAIEKVTKKEFNLIYGERRMGDSSIIIADPTKANHELGWFSSYSLEAMIKDAWLSWE